MPEVTENGITFFRTSDLDSFRTITTTGVDEDTTVNIAFTGTTVSLNFDKTKIKDPDVDFNTETSVFQYVLDDYLENNPGTINNVIQSYVGQYFSDTVENQTTIED
jgi:2-polyprenyl-6-methoxyphenol hydroxylase-like FAD-dependent oxidoreductase